jgi:hypothetical protein
MELECGAHIKVMETRLERSISIKHNKASRPMHILPGHNAMVSSILVSRYRPREHRSHTMQMCGYIALPCTAHSSALIIRVHPLVRPYRVQQRRVVVLHQGTMTYLGSGIRYVYPSASKSYITMVTLYGHGYYKHEH